MDVAGKNANNAVGTLNNITCATVEKMNITVP